MPPVKQHPSDTDRVIITAQYEHLSPQRLFECFTQPDLLPKWWTPAAEIDARQGGAYHFWWEQMNWHLRGVYREFVPGRRLVFTWKWDHEPDVPERTVEIDFLPGANSGSRLMLTHGFYQPEDADERTGHSDGWLYFLPLINGIA